MDVANGEQQRGRAESRRPRIPGDLRLIVLLAASGLVVFAAERALILLFWADRFAGVPWEQRVQAFLVGGRLDLSLLALLLVPVWLLVQALRRHGSRTAVPRVAVGLWVGLWAALLTVGMVADVVHFDEVGARLDGRTLDDLRQPRVLVDALVNAPWVAVALLVICSLGALVGRWINARLQPAAAAVGARRLGWRWTVAIGVVLVLGATARMHGDVSTWWGGAYFSEHHQANQLAMNGPYTLLLSVVGEIREDEILEPIAAAVPEDEALAAVLPVIARQDEVAGSPASPLWRHTDTGRPQRDLNVVIVILESFDARAVEALGGRRGLSPNFARLIEDGVLFTRFHAAGTRSNRGLAAVVSGLPALPGSSPLRASRVQRGLFTIGDVLRERGYATFFVTAGDRHYDNLDAYALSNGFDRVIDKHDVPSPVFETEWGVSDEDLYRHALVELDAVAADERPFCSVLITVSSHRPYRFPEGRIERGPPTHRRAEIHNSLRYADWALGQFMEEAATRSWFPDTVFAFVADHGKDVRPVDGPDVDSSRIPLLLYGPGILGEPRRIDDVASQADVPPTLLGLLGGAYDHCFLGADLLGEAPPQRASMVLGDTLLWREDDLVAAWVPEREPVFYAMEDGLPHRLAAADVEPAVARRMLERLRGQARLTRSLTLESRYRRPPRAVTR